MTETPVEGQVYQHLGTLAWTARVHKVTPEFVIFVMEEKGVPVTRPRKKTHGDFWKYWREL